MDAAPSSWPRRFLNATPPMPDGVFVGFILLLVLLLGLCLGIVWCGRLSTEAVERLAVQAQLKALDKRLQALEAR